MNDFWSGLKKARIGLWMGAAVLGWMLSGCGVSLAADVTPPPDYQPPATPVPERVETVFPVALPDPAAGKAIFAVKCAACHGLTGLSDGEQSGNLPTRPPQIGLPEVARQASAADWYQVVTNGRLEQMMPPFGQSLSDRERWDVVAYSLSLSVPQEELAAGMVLYMENCSSCHGVNGRAGQTDVSVPDWGDPAVLPLVTLNEIYAAAAEGVGQMPGFAEKLNEKELWAVAGFVRSLGYQQQRGTAASGETPQGAATPGAAESPSSDPQDQPAPAAKARVEGQVENGSGGAVPAGLDVTLSAYENMQLVNTQAAVTDALGRFRFENVELPRDRVYLASVNYEGFVFTSDLLRAAEVENGAAVSLPVLIYDKSTDTGGLSADRLHIFFDFSDPTKMQVVSLYIISNLTDRVITAAEEGQPVVEFELPEGAENLQFEEGTLGERFVQTEKGFGDRTSIFPQPMQHQLLFAYDLPYNKKLKLSLPQPVQVGAVILALPTDGVRLSGEGLEDAGEREVQGQMFHFYNMRGLEAGSALELSLNGRPGSGAGISRSSLGQILIGAGVFLLTVAGAVLWVSRQRKANQPAAEEAGESQEADSTESLMDAIIALDDLYREGKLPEEAYQTRRAELKARLAKLQAAE